MKIFGLTIVLIGVGFFILFLTQGDPFVRSDGFYYYHTAKTLVDKGSFATNDEPILGDCSCLDKNNV